jgi:hypothetical protein
MGFLDKFKKRKDEERQEGQSSDQQKNAAQPSGAGKKIKKYNSEGKPISD